MNLVDRVLNVIPMKEVRSFPPNYEEVKNRFNLKNINIVFAYGNKLFNPGGGRIGPDLWVHEKTHQRQQLKKGVKKWWKQYLIDSQFRLDQEVEAYRNQYQYALEHYNRDLRRRLLKHIVNDLSGSMYGNLVSKCEAERLITASQNNEIKEK